MYATVLLVSLHSFPGGRKSFKTSREWLTLRSSDVQSCYLPFYIPVLVHGMKRY